MNEHHSQSTLKRTGALAATVLTLAGLAACGGDGDQTQVKATFVSAAPLVTGNEVKIDGIVVGTIEALSVDGGKALVTMNLDPEALPLHQDATFTIRPASLLGERYVDLDRGTEDAPMLDTSATVPVEQTGSNVGLDEVLNTLDDPTGSGLAELLTTLGTGMAGNGENVDEAIVALAPTMIDTKALAGVLKNHNTLLNQLVEDAEPIAAALADRDGKSLDQVVDSSDRLLAAADAQQEELDRLIAKLPGTLATARKTLVQLDATADQTAPTLAALRPLTDKLPAVSKELHAFADALDPALASSQPVLDRAQDLLDQAARPAADLEKASPDLATAVHGARPVVEAAAENRESVFDFIRFWALNTNGFDGLSHYWRVSLTFSNETWTGLLGLLGGGSLLPTGTADAAAPAETKAPLADLTGQLTGTVDDLLGSVLGGGLLQGGLLGGGSTSGSASGSTSGGTGLTSDQESSLLGFLFGANGGK